MATREDESSQDSYPPEVIGYAEPWIVAPGDSVAIKISCTEPAYTYRTVRLIQGIDLEHAPKKLEEEITEIPRGQRPGRFQTAKPGSYAHIPHWGPPLTAEGLQVSFYVQPWLIDCPHTQTLVSTLDPTAKTGFSLTLGSQGSLQLNVGTKNGMLDVATGLVLSQKTWTKAKLILSQKSVQLSLTPIPFKVEPVPPPTSFRGQLDSEALLFQPGPLLIAASLKTSPPSTTTCTTRLDVTDFFNGRIDGLSLKTVGSQSITLAKYDFALDISSDHITDVSGHGHNGVLINAPTRAIKGHDWDGSESDWTRAHYGYGAIHFHDDDMDDAAWETDFVVTIPRTACSGAYAVEVEAVNGRDKDAVTFFVRPNQWTAKAVEENKKKVCLVFSTFTYLAYANERLYDKTRPNGADLGPGFDISKALKSSEFYKMQRRLDLGLSCYDRHNDSSGVCFSSSRRPILNVRPGYIMWGFSRPRELSADLFMVGLLEQEGIPYEIVTDHDLHARGAAALQGFNTVLTGCHPEYPSLASYRAYTAYARSGGNLMYLGGNGFYWVSALHESGHRLEIRRGDTGVRSYTSPGGEHVTSLDGQRSGLWRSRGMSCNTLFGIGFSGQGTGLGVPYRRTEASRNAAYSWIFSGFQSGSGQDGDEGDDLIGVNGFGGGASGDEIDRFDVGNGSPEAAVVLATSTGHSDEFGIAVEDLEFPVEGVLGTQTSLIRSDIVYYVGVGGGGVFSVGSINWYCSLAWDAYKNNVARLTLNVIRGFLAGKR